MLKKILLTVVLMVSGTCCASEYERVCDFNQQDSDYIKNLQRELWSLDIPRHQEDRLHIGFLKIDEHALEAVVSIARYDATSKSLVINEFFMDNDEVQRICGKVGQFLIDQSQELAQYSMHRLSVGQSHILCIKSLEE